MQAIETQSKRTMSEAREAFKSAAAAYFLEVENGIPGAIGSVVTHVKLPDGDSLYVRLKRYTPEEIAAKLAELPSLQQQCHPES